MSRVCKKIFGLLGLALVVGVTAVAAGLPPVEDAIAAASQQNVTVQVTVVDGEFMANITSPSNGEIKYNGESVNVAVSYDNAQSLKVYLTGPDGVRQFVGDYTPSDYEAGNFEMGLPVDAGYGKYIVEVEGTDFSGSPMVGSTVEFEYKAVSTEPKDDEDGTLVNEPGSLTVSYGKGVCSLGFQVYAEDDVDLSHPLLENEYKVEVTPADAVVPVTIDVVIPGFANLETGKYRVVTTAYACGEDAEEVVDESVVVLEKAEGLEPPKTGVINVLGVTISQVDYVVTGVIVFVLVSLFAIFLMRRKSRRN